MEMTALFRVPLTSPARSGALRRGAGYALAVPLALLSVAPAHAQSTAAPDAWRYGWSIYGYFPSIGGATSAATSGGGGGGGGPTLDVDAGKVIDALKFTVMTSLDASNGRYGFFTDLIYLDLGGSKQRSRDFTIDGAPISANTSADLSWDLKGVLWTLAGQYRVPTDPRLTLNLLGGVRMFWLEPSLRWNIYGDAGGIASAARVGEASESQTLWDGIVGVKGRWALDDAGRWSVPFYADVGTGQSHLTWQAALGVSYAFDWGDITGMWRYISYDMKSGDMVDKLNFNGPMVGATFRW